MQKEEITIQSLTDNKDIQVGYSDNDIVIIDNIQKFAEINTAHVTMNGIAICIEGIVQGKMNGKPIELHRNQVAIVPQHVSITDLMISPDFKLKAMFFTNQILQNFLREKMIIWNDVIYVHRINIITMEDEDLLFYTNFYDMLTLYINKGSGNPFRTEVIQGLLRSAILGLCGALKQKLQPINTVIEKTNASNIHFQKFLELLNRIEVKHNTVEWYASELCISPKYLSAICKSNSGKTANAWITEHVMEDIRYYLKHTDLTIKQVCDRLGFANPSFFGKYVKAHFGMTPKQFKQEL